MMNEQNSEKKFVIVSEEYPRVILTMSAEQDQNRLTVGRMTELIAYIRRYSSEESCREIILTGSGEYFCFGGYFGDRHQLTSEQILEFANVLTELHQLINECPKITLAAVNGKAGGGGVSLIDSCDLAVMEAKATIELPEIRHDSAPMISLLGVRNALPKKICMELMMGRVLTAQTCLGLGLVNSVCPADVVTHASRFLEGLPRANLTARDICKQYYNRTMGLDYNAQLDIGRQYLVSMLKTR